MPRILCPSLLFPDAQAGGFSSTSTFSEGCLPVASKGRGQGCRAAFGVASAGPQGTCCCCCCFELSPAGPSEKAAADGLCPICLGDLDTVTYVEVCRHRFCFICIREWAKLTETFILNCCTVAPAGAFVPKCSWPPFMCYSQSISDSSS
uniref:RING-type E3 ubiquitin transferase n=1 Tax=Malurus cyaneus samueli TaxID=2593467 RepID=A0A8C5TI47_9PASS